VKPGKDGWDKYKLATVACSDLKELSLAFGTEIANEDSPVEQAGRELQSRLGISRVAVLRGRKGFSIIRSGETTHHEGVAPREGGSATEAETVISVAARLTASGLGVDAALSIAAEAARLAALEPHASIVKRVDIIKAISKVDLGEEGRRITWSYAEAGRIAAHLKHDSRKVVFANGCFDVLHPGHLSLLRRARALGDYLIVGLNDDASIRRLKGPARPVNDERTRAVLLSGLRFVDLVAVFTEDTPTELLRAVQPDILVKGSEYRLEEIPGREFATDTVLLDMVPGFSSTASIKNIKAK
jgi:D-beta-D-heptose 7-phosphate kinase/D-beta-D-heptose 1-phosphate adenosyltransferase